MRYSEYQKSHAEQPQTPTLITISIGADQKPDENSKMLGASGCGSGYANVYGKMTSHQRDMFLMHIQKYAALLVKEAEAEMEFRDEWDKGQDEIDRQEVE